MISGKALSMLVELRGLPRDSTCILKAKLENLISKDMNLVFYLSVNKLVHYFQTKDYDEMSIFILIQSNPRHSKKSTSG